MGRYFGIKLRPFEEMPNGVPQMDVEVGRGLKVRFAKMLFRCCKFLITGDSPISLPGGANLWQDANDHVRLEASPPSKQEGSRGAG